MKKGIVILGLVSAISLSACGSIPVLNSSSDDSEVIAQSKAVSEQSKAVVEESKAVVEESKAVEKARGNEDSIEETEPEGEESTEGISTNKNKDISISHPAMILECSGQTYDITTMTVADLARLCQDMGVYLDADMTKKLEPYGYSNVKYENGRTTIYSYVYNPYNKEIALKDAKIRELILLEKDISDTLFFLNSTVNKNNSAKEWQSVFQELGGNADVAYATTQAAEMGKPKPENPSVDINSKENIRLDSEFELTDGRITEISIEFLEGKFSSISYSFEPYYE